MVKMSPLVARKHKNYATYNKKLVKISLKVMRSYFTCAFAV